MCKEVFERKNAADVNFGGVPGYNEQAPIEIDGPEVGDNAIVPYEGNDGVNDVPEEGTMEGGNEADDELDGALENQYGWGSDGYSSEASQNTWSR